jgi:hypothetical protein
MTKYFDILLLLAFTLTSCGVYNDEERISQKEFLHENWQPSFDYWKNWHLFSRSNYYIADYDSSASYNQDDSLSGQKIRRLIFFERYNIKWVRLFIRDSTTLNNVFTKNVISKGIPVDSLLQDPIWKGYYDHIDVATLKSVIDFVLRYDYGLNEVFYGKRPERLYFKGDSINLLYLYDEIDTPAIISYYSNKITPHWYSR